MSTIRYQRPFVRPALWWPVVVGYAALGGAALAYRPVSAAAVAAAGGVAAGLAATRHRPVREVLVLCGLLVAGTVDWSRSLHLGPITGSGVLTIIAAVLFPLGWCLAPRWATRNVPLAALLLAAFVGWVVLSFAYHPPSAAGLQNALVWIAVLGTVGTVMVSVTIRPNFARDISLAIAASSVIALGLYSASVARGGLDPTR